MSGNAASNVKATSQDPLFKYHGHRAQHLPTHSVMPSGCRNPACPTMMPHPDSLLRPNTWHIRTPRCTHPVTQPSATRHTFPDPALPASTTRSAAGPSGHRQFMPPWHAPQQQPQQPDPSSKKPKYFVTRARSCSSRSTNPVSYTHLTLPTILRV